MPPDETDLVSNLIVEIRGNHELVRVWNRTGFAGELTVKNGDGAFFAFRLMGGEDSESSSRVLPDGSRQFWPGYGDPP